MTFTGAIGALCVLPLRAIIRLCVVLRIHPNTLTLIGSIINIGAAWALAYDRFALAGVVIIVANIFDFIDGKVAHITNTDSRFGAFWDSTLDRFSDIVLFLGLIFFYSKLGRSDYVMTAALALIFSVMTSYTRARAESVVQKCKVGFMERPERIVLFIIGAFTNRMAAALWVILVLSILAIANRIYYTYVVLNQRPLPSRHGWRGLFDRRIRLVMLIALGLAFFQQITGINAIFYYLPTIFAQAGGGVSDAFRQAVIVGLVNVVMTVVAIRLIDRLGRKPLLIIGIAGMAVSLLTISWAFSVAPHDPALADVAPTVNAPLVLIAIIGFVASFAISLGPVMWVLLSEIFPNEYRGVAISAAGFWNALVSASVTFVFPWELSTLGPAGTFLVYGLFASAALLFVLVFVRETKGRTLEELEGELLSRPKTTAA